MRASSIAASACPESIIAHSAYSDLGPRSYDPVCAARTDDATMPCASPAPVDAIGLRRSVFPSMSTEPLGHGAWSRPMGNRAVVTLSTRLPDRELLAREGTAGVADASRRRFVLGLFLEIPPKLLFFFISPKTRRPLVRSGKNIDRSEECEPLFQNYGSESSPTLRHSLA